MQVCCQLLDRSCLGVLTSGLQLATIQTLQSKCSKMQPASPNAASHRSKAINVTYATSRDAP